MDSLESLLDYLSDEICIGIATFDNVISYYQFENNEMLVYKNIDKDNIGCPLSYRDLFLNVK